MAIARIPTLLPLDRYAVVMGLSLVHFNNLSDAHAPAVTHAYWNQAKHDALARYLVQAEIMLRHGGGTKPGLGFDIAPTALQDHLSVDPAFSLWTEATLQSVGHIQAFGRWQYTLIEADAPVIYTGDIGQVSLGSALDGTEPGEVQVFYRTADGAQRAAQRGWQIRPLDIFTAGTSVGITGHKAQFVQPSVLAASAPADYDDPAHFVTAVDVYRVTVDTSLPVTLVWDAWSASGQSDPSAVTTQTAVVYLEDSTLGLFRVRPACRVDDETRYMSPALPDMPDTVIVDLIAGHPLFDAEQGLLEPQLEDAVIRLANVLSPDYGHWLNDLAMVRWRDDRALPSQDNPLQPGEEDCPFGLTNGARTAWRVVRQKRISQVAL